MVEHKDCFHLESAQTVWMTDAAVWLGVMHINQAKALCHLHKCASFQPEQCSDTSCPSQGGLKCARSLYVLCLSEPTVSCLCMESVRSLRLYAKLARLLPDQQTEGEQACLMAEPVHNLQVLPAEAAGLLGGLDQHTKLCMHPGWMV